MLPAQCSLLRFHEESERFEALINLPAGSSAGSSRVKKHGIVKPNKEYGIFKSKNKLKREDSDPDYTLGKKEQVQEVGGITSLGNKERGNSIACMALSDQYNSFGIGIF